MATETEKIADVLRYVPGACLIVQDGVVLGANEDAIGVFGIPRARLVGAPLPELTVPEMQFGLARFLDEAKDVVSRHRFRLAAGLTPIELSSRRLSDSIVILGARIMELEHQMSALAGGELTHDQVTGLPNRYHVLEQLHQRLGAANARSLAIIAIWIDDLVHLGDERGPRVIERVSRQVGERVQSRLRRPDVLGRFEDGAFLAVLASDSTPAQLAEIAERLRNEVSLPVEFDGGLVGFTASVLVGSIGGPRRPTIDLIQNRLEAGGAKLAASGGNRTETITF
ncbi:MAG: diguanylate cyclase [Actinomycetota bacterium]|nr:diguanylate cyclase [Actinomycetota bacterium]